jgi:hypothetical protein
MEVETSSRLVRGWWQRKYTAHRTRSTGSHPVRLWRLINLLFDALFLASWVAFVFFRGGIWSKAHV